MTYSNAMRAPLALGVSLAAVLAATAAPARAEERAVLVVDATADRSGATVAGRLNVALGPDTALRRAEADVVAGLAVATPVDDGAFTAATATLATARERLARFAHSEAATLARSAQDALAGEADRPAARELIADLAFVEALAIAGDADLAAAAPTFALVHRLSPGRTLDPARHVPELIRAFEAATVVPVATGALMVAAPGATEVLVDGVSVGPEPALAQVAPGPHIVTARGEALLGSGRRIEAAAGKTVRIDLISVVAPLALRAARARDRLVAATDEASRLDALADLLDLGGAADAIVLVTVDGVLASRLYTERGGLGPARPVGDDLAAVLQPLRPLPKVRQPPPTRIPPPPDPETPWYERGWVQATVGVGATAVVIAVIAAIVSRDPGSSALMPGLEVE